MKQQWDVNEIIEQFTLLPPEFSFLGSSDPHNHLGKALLLKFFQHEGRFPDSIADWRGLMPLFYTHINPYGVFDLDMDARIPLVGQTATVA